MTGETGIRCHAIGIREAGFTSVSTRLVEWLSVRKRIPDLARLRDIVSPSPGIRLLDVGGGAGAATEQFASGCGVIVVLEPDARKVTLGRTRRPSIRFEQGRGAVIPFGDGSFDWVVAVVAFHHMEDQRRVLREMYRVLRPGGRVAFLELPPSEGPGGFRRWIGSHRHGAQMTFLGANELKAHLESAGFQEATWESGVRCYLTTATKPR